MRRLAAALAIAALAASARAQVEGESWLGPGSWRFDAGNANGAGSGTNHLLTQTGSVLLIQTGSGLLTQ